MIMRKISWEEILDFINKTSTILSSKEKIDVVLAIGSSGLVPAALIATKLKTTEFYSIKVERYNEGKPPKILYEEPIIRSPLNMDLNGKNVLIVDDLINTGKTITKILEIVQKMKAKKIVTLVLVLKKGALFKPNYYYLEIDSCPVFPWEM
ncbi:MAG: hypothetical protein DRJ38_03740 [Thermoprotei archaeon]|nr:MAG: hypothetical protein DRJ38_03740 [Thermoprotei archaeon]